MASTHLSATRGLVLAVYFTAAVAMGADEPPKQDPSGPSIGVGVTDLKDIMDGLKQGKTVTLPPTKNGVLILRVLPGGPADDAGLRPTDIITRIGKRSIVDSETFVQAVSDLRVGAKTQVTVRRLTPTNRMSVWRLVTVYVTPVTQGEVDRLRKLCPVRIAAAAMTRNIIGSPEVSVRMTNTLHQEVIAVRVEIDCENRFGERIRPLGAKGPAGRAIYQETIAPFGSATATWTLSLHDTATKAKIRIVQLKLGDGAEWKATGDEGEVTVVEMTQQPE